MTDNEINILREERVRQLQASLGQRAGLANAICKEFGEKGLEVIKKEIERDIISWINTIVDQYKKNGIDLDINGIHSFLWEENKNENIEYTYQDNKDTRKYIVTRCPLAEYAIKNGISNWGKIFFCDTYEIITKTFNPEIKFSFIQKMMDEKKCCIFTYQYKKTIL